MSRRWPAGGRRAQVRRAGRLTYMIAPNATPTVPDAGVRQAAQVGPVARFRAGGRTGVLPDRHGRGIDDRRFHRGRIRAMGARAFAGGQLRHAGARRPEPFPGPAVRQGSGHFAIRHALQGHAADDHRPAGRPYPVAVTLLQDLLRHHRAGKVRLLGIFSDKRSPLAPDIPTMAEQGFPVRSGDAWTAMWAPVRTPQAEIARMQTALKTILAAPQARQSLMAQLSVVPDYLDGEQMARRSAPSWKRGDRSSAPRAFARSCRSRDHKTFAVMHAVRA